MNLEEGVGYNATLRDKVVVSVANILLRLASKNYRQFLKGVIVLGMAAAADKEVFDKLKENRNGNS